MFHSKLYTKTKVITLIVILFSINACDKDSLIIEVDPGVQISDKTYFRSLEEVYTKMDVVNSLSLEELIAYENKAGYISFGRRCEEVYFSIDPENIQSIEELTAFVAKNKEYVCLETDEFGELEYKIVNGSNPFRYLANEEKIFYVKNEVYKVFEDGLISTEKKNFARLKAINCKSVNEVVAEDGFTISPFKTESKTELKDATYSCGVQQEATSTNGKNRLKMEITASWQLNQMVGGYNVWYGATVLIRPQKKTLVWLNCSRTITCDLNVALDYKINTWGRKVGHYSDTKSTSKLEKVVASYNQNISGSGYSFGYHLGGYDLWADTPDVYPVTLTCNTGLVD